jgi:hypothetical protein
MLKQVQTIARRVNNLLGSSPTSFYFYFYFYEAYQRLAGLPIPLECKEVYTT